MMWDRWERLRKADTVERYIVTKSPDRPSPEAIVEALRSDGHGVDIAGDVFERATSFCFELTVAGGAWVIVDVSEDFDLAPDLSNGHWEMVIDFVGRDAAQEIRRLVCVDASPDIDVAVVDRIVELLVEATNGWVVRPNWEA